MTTFLAPQFIVEVIAEVLIRDIESDGCASWIYTSVQEDGTELISYFNDAVVFENGDEFFLLIFYFKLPKH